MAFQLDIDRDTLSAFCHDWKVAELSFFGSILRDDFNADSDIDVLVSFHPGAPWSLWDLIEMRERLQTILGRPVDLVEREALRNPWRKREILRTREVIYAA